MNFFKKIDSFLGKMGSLKASERNYVDTVTEEKITDVIGDKIAIGNNGGIWASNQELAGYQYLNITIIGQTKIKTFHGCTLTFVSDTNEILLQLPSDTREIESDHSNISNLWVTQVSFDITETNIDVLNNKTSFQIVVESKKTREVFETLKLIQQL